MWETVAVSGLAFAVATLLCISELITGSYARTHFLLYRSLSLWTYAAVYGFIAAALMVLLDSLIAEKIVTVEGVGASNRWVQAIFIGLSIKALLHIRIFNVRTSSGSFPVGIETIVQLFEPWLLRNIELDHFNASRALIDPRALKYTDLDVVKDRIRNNIPPTFSVSEKASLLADLNQSDSVHEAMEKYLFYLGKKTFDRVFPE